MRVGIVGFGYVGQGMYRLFSPVHDVRYHDTNGVSNCGGEDGINECEIVFVCVPTPMCPDGSCDTTIVESVVKWCKAPVIVVKSTVAPGTCDTLSQHYRKNVHFSPEYMGEGKQFVAPWKYPNPRDARSHDFVIVGGDSADMVLDLYATVLANDARYIATTNIAAELAKYMENAYLAVKVAFCYEYAQVCAAYGSDYKTVRELWLNDPRMGRSHTMVLPDQKGFNGKCLPKDISAIVEDATLNGFDPLMLRAVRDINAKRMS